MDVSDAADACDAVLDAVAAAVIADRRFLEEVLVGMLAGGHVLVEDVPGTGKTLTARSLARALDVSFGRIQFTPDMLPADVTGTNVYDERDDAFTFVEGPAFANLVLADEINRSPPKTQAALLEAMEEGQVTVDGDEHALPDPFFVIATQNPIDLEGTFRLPEAQLDRFVVKTRMGYPDHDGELELLRRRSDRTTSAPTAERVLDRDALERLLAVPETVTVADEIRGYMADVCRATRDHDRVDVGVSPRGLERFFEASRARAALRGRDYVVPDDVKALARPVLAHRLVLDTASRVDGLDERDVIAGVLDRVEAPTPAGETARGD